MHMVDNPACGQLNSENERVSVCLCAFFTLTDRASTIPSNILGCQSSSIISTWSARQEDVVETCSQLQREHKNKNKTKRKKGNKRKKENK